MSASRKVARKASGKATHGAVSKAQWRWMFSTHQTFAHRWAEHVEATRGKKVGTGRCRTASARRARGPQGDLRSRRRAVRRGDQALGLGHARRRLAEAIEALLLRSAEDVDAFLMWPAPSDPVPPAVPPDPVPSTRIDVDGLTLWQQQALQRAVIQQSIYRLVIGEEDLAEGISRLASVSGGGQSISFSALPPPAIGEAVKVVLAGSGLWSHRTNCAPDVDSAA